MRIIDREQAKIVAGFRSTTRANTRLLKLVRAGLLRRFFLGTGVATGRALYALSRKGADLIAVPYRGPRLRNGELLAANPFVHHQLSINEVHCTLKTACAHAADVTFGRWIAFHEPLTPQIRLIPDAYFELSTPAGTLAAFLELDLGNEVIAVWKQKVRNYLQFALSGDCERRFAQTRFRVLVIANSDRRLTWLRKVVKASTEKIFWFTTIESIRSKDFLSAIWLRPNGEECQALLSQSL